MDTLANTEIGIGIETRKRRLPFEALAQMDQEKRTEEIEDQKEKINNALNAFYKLYANRKLPDVRLEALDKDNLEKIFGYMAEAIVETKFVLRETQNTYYEFLPPEPVSGDDDEWENQYAAQSSWGSMILEIGFDHFVRNLEAYRNSTKVREVKQDIYVGIPHEMAHFYVERHYPKTDDKSVAASALALEGDNTLYDKDRAEQFVEKFGQEYAAYKRAEEQRIRAATRAEELEQQN